MKKLVSIIIVAVLVLSFCMPTYAQEEIMCEHEVGEMTVIFDEPSDFTPEEKQHIIELLSGKGTEYQTRGLLCTLFGHTYKTGTVITITHCVNDKQPKCLEETFELKECTRCGNTEVDRLNHCYITCCP